MTKKALTLPMLIAMVVGNMIGTGIFVLPASLANYGTISIFSWMFTACGAMLFALTFVHLNKRYPKTGGPYTYCKQAFGRLVGFIVAVMYWFVEIVSIAGISIASTGYLGFVFPMLNSNSPEFSSTYALIFELGMVWLFTLINILGIHFAGVVQLFLTTIKVTPLIIIILVGAGSIHLENLMQLTVDHTSTFTAFSGAAAITFWAFIGLEAATIPSENTSGPKDISKATIIGTLISSSVYIASTIVLMGMISVSVLKTSQFPFAEAGAMLFGPFGALLIALFACLSGIGALNVCIMILGQIVFAAARDNIFPHWLAKLSKNNVPIRGHIISSILISLLLIVTMEATLLKQFNNIALLAALLALTTYMAATFAEIKFGIIEKKTLKAILSNSSTVIAVLAAIYAIWMISSINPETIKIGFMIIAGCVPTYFLFIRKS